MHTRRVAFALVALTTAAAGLTGCKSSQKACCASANNKTCCDPSAQTPPAPATLTARDAEFFEPLKALAGDWGMEDENGTTLLTNQFAVSSSNSVIREVMFPGHPHEMTNLYHMDGPNLVITHYCAAGNQPRMIAREVKYVDGARVYHFKVDSVSNRREGQHGVMDEMILTIGVDGSVRQDWYGTDPTTGQRAGPTVFAPHRLGSGS